MKKYFAVFCALCVGAALFAGCIEEEKFSTKAHTYYKMDTSADLVITDNFANAVISANFEKLEEEIESTLNGIENSVSAHIETSGIYAFNQAEAGATVEIDQTAFTILAKAKDVYMLTEGYYNPAVYYSVYEYGFHGLFNFMTEENLPSDEAVQKYKQLAENFGKLEISEEDGKFYAKKPDATVEIDGETYSMKIDLGGIGKGYAVDAVNRLLDEYGFKYGYFNFGSSSLAVKRHYENTVYRLGFTQPRSEYAGETYLTVPVNDVCISTSGDYERYYEINGVRYCHIIDPTTGKPVQTGIYSATVIGGSAAEDDALTTAIMCMGKEKAVSFITEKLSDRKVAFYHEDGIYKFGV